MSYSTAPHTIINGHPKPGTHDAFFSASDQGGEHPPVAFVKGGKRKRLSKVRAFLSMPCLEANIPCSSGV